MKEIILVIFLFSVQSSFAQAGFKRVNDTLLPKKEETRSLSHPRQSQSAGTPNSEARASQQLIIDYSRLPETVRQRMASNKAGGLPIGNGIRKYYVLTMPFSTGSREAGAFETAIRSLPGFVSFSWMSDTELALHVETAVQSERIKEKIQTISSRVIMQAEQYYAY